VTANGAPIDQLNELDIVDGEVLAISGGRTASPINPSSGHVVAGRPVRTGARVNTSDQDEVPNVSPGQGRRRLFRHGQGLAFLFEIKPPKHR